MDLIIRDATMQDYPAMCELFEEGDHLHREALPDIFRKPRGAPREETVIRAFVTDPEIGVLVAEEGDQVIGCLIVMVRKAPEYPILVPLRYAMIDVIVVRRDHQRNGVGRALMHRAETWALARGIDRVELNVFEFNQEARAFYERLGYTTLSRRMVKRNITRA